MDNTVKQTWNLDGYSEESAGYDLDSINGRQEWKAFFRGWSSDDELKEMFMLSSTGLFLLCGKAGTGKITMAYAFAADLIRQGYCFYDLYADELVGTEKGDTLERISCLLKKAEEGHMAVLLRRLELLEEPAAIRLLSRGLLKLRHKGLPFVCLATSEREAAVCPELLSCFWICRLEPPKMDERVEYFEAQISGSFACESGIDSRKMAEMTEGFSYGQMAKAAEYVRAVLCGSGQKQYGSPAVMKAMKNRLTVTKKLFKYGVLLAGEDIQVRTEALMGETEGISAKEQILPAQNADIKKTENNVRQTEPALEMTAKRPTDIQESIPSDASIDEIMSWLVNPDEI